MIAAGLRASISAAGMVCGTISEYTLRLAHAAGDELGVLSPEIDDENGVMIGVHGTIVSGRKLV